MTMKKAKKKPIEMIAEMQRIVEAQGGGQWHIGLCQGQWTVIFRNELHQGGELRRSASGHDLLSVVGELVAILDRFTAPDGSID